MKLAYRLFPCLALVAAIVCIEARPLHAQAPSAGRSRALLIGIEKYHRVPALHFTINDVRTLSKTLRTRGGYVDILELTDDAAQPRFQPLKASIEAELPDWLKQAAPDDMVLVYFSGHGFRDPAGNMFLAPIDCNPADLNKTALPISWLRQEIANCKARFKLLILDSCHSGSEKGEGDQQSVTSNDLGNNFKDLENVVTIASSTAKQPSQLWDDKQQSLFSYWLNQGLKGNADENGDGTVDIDELYKYVYRNVTNTAKAHMPLPQTPVRIVRSGTPDVPTVVRLQPLSLRQVLTDTAEQLADTIEDRKLPKVGVLEFTNDTKLGELLGADFGLLGRYCAEELERRLASQGEGKFAVVDRRRLQMALSSQGFKLNDLGSAVAMKQLAASAGGMPTIALGTLRNRAGQVVGVQCKLVCIDGDEVAGSSGGTARLNESEWAMLGRSAVVKPEDRRPEAPPPGNPPPGSTPSPAPNPTAKVIQKLDTRSEGPHPFLDPKFPFPIKMMIGGKERKGIFRGNDYFVPVHKGEVYELWVENRSTQTALMRLLVDGLNTLPEKELTKGVQLYVVGKRVNLDDARAWELDPGALYAVRGFVTETGLEGKLREFTVVDANDSLAARQKFTDQIGIITAAFYAPASHGSRSVGTGLGQSRTEVIEKAKTLPGNLLAVVHIRYVEAEALEK